MKNYHDAYRYLAASIHRAMQRNEPVSAELLYVFLFEADKLATGEWRESPKLQVLK